MAAATSPRAQPSAVALGRARSTVRTAAERQVVSRPGSMFENTFETMSLTLRAGTSTRRTFALRATLRMSSRGSTQPLGVESPSSIIEATKGVHLA